MRVACCCGEDHSQSKYWPMVVELVSKHGETVIITTPQGAWHVPRAFVAAHGIRGMDVPSLAKKYSWKLSASA